MRGNLPVRFLGEGAAVTPLSYPTGGRACWREAGWATLAGMAADLRDVDPAELRVPGSRASGADPYKLQQQIARFGASAVGMPPIWVYEGSDGVLEIANGVTRATRIAKLAPGSPVRVEVIGKRRRAHGPDPKIGDLL